MMCKETLNFVRFIQVPSLISWLMKTTCLHSMQDSATVHTVICCIAELIRVLGECIIFQGFCPPHSSNTCMHDFTF
jgi:hypothetical protein